MNKNEIRSQIVEAARKYAADKLDSTFETNELKSYHILSANLLKFMPDVVIRFVMSQLYSHLRFAVNTKMVRREGAAPSVPCV